VRHHGVAEIPIACTETFGRRLRHGQLTALSRRELIALIRHARDAGQDSVTLVSHSFELLSRDRLRINRIVEHRFRHFCAALGALPGVTSATYASRPPALQDQRDSRVLPHDPLRSGARVVEQALVNALYSRPTRLGAHHALAVGTVLFT
jgi:hypothetical protein